MSRLGTSLCVAVCLAYPAWSKPQDFGSLLGGLLNGGGGAARALGGGGGLGDIASNIRNAIRSNPVIQQRILTNDLNPCDGAPPASCQCTDGETIAFSIEYNSNPCQRTRGATPDRCTCPSGETFLVKDVAQRAADRFNIPTCGGDQRPSSCECRDGSIASLTDAAPGRPPCPGRGLSALPQSCTCPNGNTIQATEVISRVIPAIQQILG